MLKAERQQNKIKSMQLLQTDKIKPLKRPAIWCFPCGACQKETYRKQDAKIGDTITG